MADVEPIVIVIIAMIVLLIAAGLGIGLWWAFRDTTPERKLPATVLVPVNYLTIAAGTEITSQEYSVSLPDTAKQVLTVNANYGDRSLVPGTSTGFVDTPIVFGYFYRDRVVTIYFPDQNSALNSLIEPAFSTTKYPIFIYYS